VWVFVNLFDLAAASTSLMVEGGGGGPRIRLRDILSKRLPNQYNIFPNPSPSYFESYLATIWYSTDFGARGENL
jgi:hypothetical protein